MECFANKRVPIASQTNDTVKMTPKLCDARNSDMFQITGQINRNNLICFFESKKKNNKKKKTNPTSNVSPGTLTILFSLWMANKEWKRARDRRWQFDLDHICGALSMSPWSLLPSAMCSHASWHAVERCVCARWWFCILLMHSSINAFHLNFMWHFECIRCNKWMASFIIKAKAGAKKKKLCSTANEKKEKQKEKVKEWNDHVFRRYYRQCSRWIDGSFCIAIR